MGRSTLGSILLRLTAATPRSVAQEKRTTRAAGVNAHRGLGPRHGIARVAVMAPHPWWVQADHRNPPRRSRCCAQLEEQWDAAQ